MRRAATLAFVVSLVVALTMVSRTASGSSGLATTAFVTPIQHVIIIDQENHSFDDTLGKLCAEIDDGTVTGHEPCDGATQGTLASGAVIDLTREPDIVPDVLHSVAAQTTAIDGGKMDGFSKITGCTRRKNYPCYTQYDPSDIPNLTALAKTYVISDRTFEFATTPSWGGHMVLAAATLDGFSGDNPKQSASTTQKGPGWGCDAFNDASWWDGSQWILVPSCVPDAAGQGPYRTSPVQYVPTIFDRIEQAGLNWRIYGGNGRPGKGGYGWAICPTFYECLSTQRSNFVAASSVITDANAGTLPNLSIVTPTLANSQHNKVSMAVGDNWIGSVMSAIQNGPEWSSTAVFITYDDCGCFYDHVPPPSPDQGIRVPMVIASPYVKAGATDSTPATFVSMLAYTEHVFGLPPLNASDAGAYDYADAFDYSQSPTTAAASMVRTHVSQAELGYIAAHPPRENDPT
jgi:phospholipase C